MAIRSVRLALGCIAAVEVIALVMEAIQNTESVVIAGPDGSTRVPKAPS